MSALRAAAIALAMLVFAAACTGARPAPTEDPMAAGLRAMKEGHVEEAVTAFRRAHAADPGNPAAVRSLVEAQFRLGRIDQAIGELEQEASLRPDDDAAHFGLGLAYYARSAGSEAKALEHLQRAADLKPGVAEYQFRLGVVHLQSERYPEAVACLKRARDLEPTLARSYVPLAQALARTGDRAGAIEAIRAMLQLSPSPHDLEVARSVMARLTDPFREFPKAIQADFERGLDALDKLDAPQQAIVAFEEILEKLPDLAVVHAALGLCFQRLDDPSRAMDEFKTALSLAPDDPRNQLYLADLYFTRERLDTAADGYRAVLQRDPLSDRAYERLGAIALQRGNPAEAAEWLKTLTVLRPGDLAARQSYATALASAGSLDAAARELAFILEKEPKNVEAMLRLALVDVSRFQGEKDPALASAARARAVSQLEKVLDLQPENAFAAKTLQSLK